MVGVFRGVWWIRRAREKEDDNWFEIGRGGQIISSITVIIRATYVNQTTHSNSSPSAQAPPTVSAMRTISDVGPASTFEPARQTSGLNVGGPSLADGVAGGRGDEGNYLAKLLAG